jgi:hypothetical protein
MFGIGKPRLSEIETELPRDGTGDLADLLRRQRQTEIRSRAGQGPGWLHDVQLLPVLSTAPGGESARYVKLFRPMPERVGVERQDDIRLLPVRR